MQVIGLDPANVGFLERLYRASPVPIQNLMMSAYGVLWRRRRFGRHFKEELAEVQRRESWGKERLDAFCAERVAKLLAWAYREVPHYRRAFDRSGFDPESFSELKDLRRAPLLEKQTLRDDPEAFIARSLSRRKLHRYKTSGTTGTPLSVYYDARTKHRVTAFMEARVRRWAAVTWRDSRSMIGGRMIVPPEQEGPPYWRYNLAEKQIYLSAFHISRNTAPAYVEALNSHRPTYMTGYAASHFFLARFILEQDLDVHSPRAVIVSSETLDPHMRETIGEAFGAPVHDSYSGVEVCCLASECREGRMHLSIDHGVVELLDSEGRPVPTGETGEIVATGLVNFCQPLIRYRTGDLAVASGELCPCGSAFPVIESLLGRVEDVVITPDGREMVRFHGIYYGLEGVREGQVVQEAPARFTLRIVPSDTFGPETKEALVQRVRDRVGASVDVRVVLESDIERTERGKFRAVVSHVSRGQGELSGRGA